MKQSFRGLLSCLFLGITSWLQAQPTDLKPVWETDTTLRTPESVLFDAAQQVLYVACINGPADPHNDSSYIAKVGLDGQVIKPRFSDKLNVTKGMGILGEYLYVTELTQVVQLALSTGKVLNRYPIEGASFLNDIAINTRQGLIYVTDSNQGKVWVLLNGKANLVVAGDPLKGTNGLIVEDDQLLIGNGDGSLFRFNPATKQLRLVSRVKSSSSIDGIVALGKGTYLINEVAGKMWYVRADGSSELKLDTSSQKIRLADTGFDPATHRLFVPTLFHNTVKAYQLR